MGVIRMPTFGLAQEWNKRIDGKHIAQSLPSTWLCYCYLYRQHICTDNSKHLLLFPAICFSSRNWSLYSKVPSSFKFLRFYDTGIRPVLENSSAAQDIKFAFRLVDSLNISQKLGHRAGQSQGWLIRDGLAREAVRGQETVDTLLPIHRPRKNDSLRSQRWDKRDRFPYPLPEPEALGRYQLASIGSQSNFGIVLVPQEIKYNHW